MDLTSRKARIRRSVLADDVAAFMQAAGIGKAHVAGLSLGGAIGLWLAAKYPDKVASLSLHSTWAKSDAFQSTVVESWQILAKAVGVPEMIVGAILPWCLGRSSMPKGRITKNGGVRPQPAAAVSARFHPAIECRSRSRRGSSSRGHCRADADQA